MRLCFRGMALLIVGIVLVGSLFAGGQSDVSSGEFTPADEIAPPPGKSMFVLPVDEVADQPIRIAVIMVQNNPFGMAVKEGADFARDVLRDRNGRVDWISVPDFDPIGFENAMQNAITAQYDAITLFGLSEALTPIVNEAVANGIPVFTFNTEPGMESRRMA